MAYTVLLGIEHLMTGVCIRSENGDVISFERESPSIIRAVCSSKLDVYWPVKQNWIQGEEKDVTPEKYSEGEAEFYAQVCGSALVDIDNRSHINMQTYTRHPNMYNTGTGQPSKYASGEPSPFPPAVVKAMRRKHGKDADKYLAELRWDKDHWFYINNKMYVGVEPDGYIHT